MANNSRRRTKRHRERLRSDGETESVKSKPVLNSSARSALLTRRTAARTRQGATPRPLHLPQHAHTPTNQEPELHLCLNGLLIRKHETNQKLQLLQTFPVNVWRYYFLPSNDSTCFKFVHCSFLYISPLAGHRYIYNFISFLGEFGRVFISFVKGSYSWPRSLRTEEETSEITLFISSNKQMKPGIIQTAAELIPSRNNSSFRITSSYGSTLGPL